MPRLRLYRLSLPLREPYRLSFATLHAFDSFLVTAEGDGRIGLGEITPLPGYGAETADTVLAAWRELGGDRSARRERAQGMAAKAPMFASGVMCALETWEAGEDSLLFRQPRQPVPLAALCPGEDPDAMRAAAQRLLGEGYRSLKIKIGGGDIGTDLERIEAAADAAQGAEIRVDANQRLSAEDALRTARALEPLPNALLEQPFAPEAWDEFAHLAARTSTPLMLDESIWTSADIDRAGTIGARLVKLKLCKHPGIAATHALLDHARELGLDVVFGNGVQSVVGNHYEALLHEDAAIARASEGNGFLKIADTLLPHALHVNAGLLFDGGLDGVDAVLETFSAATETSFTI